jgi:hypothetical protein
MDPNTPGILLNEHEVMHENASENSMIQIELEPNQFQNLLENMMFIKNMVIQLNDRMQRIEADISTLKRNLVKEELVALKLTDIVFSDHEIDNSLKLRNLSGDLELLKKFYHPQFLRVNNKRIEFFSTTGWIPEEESQVKFDHILTKIQRLYLKRNNNVQDDSMGPKQEHIIRLTTDIQYRKALFREFIQHFSH